MTPEDCILLEKCERLADEWIPKMTRTPGFSFAHVPQYIARLSATVSVQACPREVREGLIRYLMDGFMRAEAMEIRTLGHNGRRR